MVDSVITWPLVTLAQANNLCYKETQTESLCDMCKLIFGFYYKRSTFYHGYTDIVLRFAQVVPEKDGADA